MSQTFERIRKLIDQNDVQISVHGYKEMTKRHVVKMVHVGEYVVEVEVELVYTDEGWSPYFSLMDALKLDDVREALQREDVETAAKFGRVYRMLPIAV